MIADFPLARFIPPVMESIKLISACSRTLGSVWSMLLASELMDMLQSKLGFGKTLSGLLTEWEGETVLFDANGIYCVGLFKEQCKPFLWGATEKTKCTVNNDEEKAASALLLPSSLGFEWAAYVD